MGQKAREKHAEITWFLIQIERQKINTQVSQWLRKHAKNIKKHQKSLIFVEKLMDPRAKCRLGYLNSQECIWRKAWNFIEKTRNQNDHFCYVRLSIFGPKTILFFRFSNSMISRSLNIFGEKRSGKWSLFFPESAGLGLGLGAGLGLA